MDKGKVIGNLLKVMVTYALNLITILIPVSVLAIDLYVNVQKIRYTIAVKDVKTDVLPWINPEYLPVSLPPDQIEKIQRNRVNRSFLERIVQDIKYRLNRLTNIILADSNSEITSNSIQQEEKKIKCSLNALKSMVEKLRAEKEKLESLHNTIIYAFNQKLDIQEPGTIQVVYYDKEEMEEFAQIASENTLLKPKRIKKENLPTDTSQDRDYLAGLLLVVEKFAELKEWLFYTPVEAKSRVSENAELQDNARHSTDYSLDIDNDSRYLFEKF